MEKNNDRSQEIPAQADADRLRRQMAFCLEIDKEKFIGRQTYLSDGVRKENDAEHAWHMAIMTLLLSEYSNEKIKDCKTKGAEIRLHFEIEEKFNVALCNKQ